MLMDILLTIIIGLLGLYGLCYRDADKRWPPAYMLFAGVMLLLAGRRCLEMVP